MFGQAADTYDSSEPCVDHESSWMVFEIVSELMATVAHGAEAELVVASLMLNRNAVRRSRLSPGADGSSRRP